MPSQPPFLVVLRPTLSLLVRIGKRLPAPAYGPRVADAQQALLVKALCGKLPPRRAGGGGAGR